MDEPLGGDNWVNGELELGWLNGFAIAAVGFAPNAAAPTANAPNPTRSFPLFSSYT